MRRVKTSAGLESIAKRKKWKRGRVEIVVDGRGGAALRVVKWMKSDLLKSKKLHTDDDTVIRVQDSGAHKAKIARLWVYVGEPFGSVYSTGARVAAGALGVHLSEGHGFVKSLRRPAEFAVHARNQLPFDSAPPLFSTNFKKYDNSPANPGCHSTVDSVSFSS